MRPLATIASTGVCMWTPDMDSFTISSTSLSLIA
jgi:hypothetical protein